MYRENIFGCKPTIGREIRMLVESKVAVLERFFPEGKGRRFHAFCVGMPRSGTHSISYLLHDHFKSEHEPKSGATVLHLLKYKSEKYSKEEFTTMLRARDKVLNLELESSHFLHHISGELAEIFPNSKFIYTFRDPYSWIQSEMRLNIRYKDPNWIALQNYRYGRYGFEFSNAESQICNIKGLHPIKSYLSYWRDHSNQVQRSIPSHRLLSINTLDIEKKVGEIAEFLNIEASMMNVDRAHSGKGHNGNFKLYDLVSPNYVRELISEICV